MKKEELVQQLEMIVDEYKSLQNERKNLLGSGRTGKRFVVKKAEMIDERLKQLKAKWVKNITAIDSTYGEMFKRTAPSKKTLNIIKQMSDEQ